MKAADLRKRLDAISAAMNGTFAARFTKLTDGDKAIYRAWKERCRAYHDQHRDGEAYARLLAGDQPPPLNRTLHAKLFDPVPVIIDAMTIEDMAETYRRVALGD